MTSRKTSQTIDSGSPDTGEPLYLTVGSLRRPHGVHGEMLMQVLTDFPERFKAKMKVFVGASRQPLTLQGIRIHQQGLLVKFEGIDTPEDAGHFRNQDVYVTAADRPGLPKGQYYHHELLGFDVVTEDGASIGRLTEILQTGANDVYVVTRPGSRDVLLPNIPTVILGLDAPRRILRVRLLSGLLDESES